MEVITFLKLVSRTNIEDANSDQFLNCLESITEKEYQLIERHKVNLLFLKHLKHFKKVSVMNNRKMREYSNQLFVLQHQYAEYLDSSVVIFNEFEKQNVPYAVLKGFSFTKDIYCDDGITYRPFSDLDILISSDSITKVTKIMEKENFIQGKIVDDDIVPVDRLEKLYWLVNSHQLSEYIRWSKYADISAKYWLEYDINTTIFEGGNILDPISASNILSNRIKTYAHNDKSYFVLNPTYNLLQLCYHFYKDTIYEIKKKGHNDFCLIKFCDIRQFILRYKDEIDWSKFVRNVNEAGIGDRIFFVLYMVEAFYGDLGIEDIIRYIKKSPNIHMDQSNGRKFFYKIWLINN